MQMCSNMQGCPTVVVLPNLATETSIRQQMKGHLMTESLSLNWNSVRHTVNSAFSSNVSLTAPIWILLYLIWLNS